MRFTNELGQGSATELIINPLADRAAEYTVKQAAVLCDEALETARRIITRWAGYAATPLLTLPGIARETGVASIWYKDEGQRFGLGSFKALGGAYAVYRLLERELVRRPTTQASDITVCCATDGNHGRSVAWGANTFGCHCVIFIHETVSESRKLAIEAFDARVVRTPGTYDDSLRIAQEIADQEGWFVVSDTSYPGYTDVPREVMQGYELMAAEVCEALPELPTHVFLQTGVGGMAAAVTAHFKRRFGTARPTIVLADPERSACWVQSIRAGEPIPVEGDLDTLMAGLACGEVSVLAWEILRNHADAVVSVADEDAVALMRRLAEPAAGDVPIVAGESAVAGLAGCMAVAGNVEARELLGLGSQSRIVVFGTEGDTDPELYTTLVGHSGEDIRARARAAPGS